MVPKEPWGGMWPSVSIRKDEAIHSRKVVGLKLPRDLIVRSDQSGVFDETGSHC